MSIETCLKQIEETLGLFAEEVRTETIREVTARMMGEYTPTKEKTVKARPVKKTANPARQLQGRYMGLLRGYKGAQNKQIKAIAKEKGVAAAIKAMVKGLAPAAPKAPKAPKAVKPPKAAPDTAAAVASAFKQAMPKAKIRIAAKSPSVPAPAKDEPPATA
jgi:hypothetical protein